jgi:hypothetical protein
MAIGLDAVHPQRLPRIVALMPCVLFSKTPEMLIPEFAIWIPFEDEISSIRFEYLTTCYPSVFNSLQLFI